MSELQFLILAIAVLSVLAVVGAVLIGIALGEWAFPTRKYYETESGDTPSPQKKA